MKCKGFAYPKEYYHCDYSEVVEMSKKCVHEWTGYIIIYCKKCNLLKDFFDGFPKQ